MLEEKERHAKRIHNKETHLAKQKRLYRDTSSRFSTAPDSFHRYAKMNLFNCGRPLCCMCGNPRKIFGELTIQEKRLFQDNENF